MSAQNQVIRCRFGNHFTRILGLVAAAVLFALASGCSSFNAQSYNSAGVRAFDQAQYDEALKEFQQANYIDPANSDAYYNLARTYHRLGKTDDRREHAQRNLAQAESYYQQCLAKDASHRDCYRGLAKLLDEQGRSDEAFDLIEGWAAGSPGSADAKVELARLHQEHNNVTESEEHLLDALRVDPQNARALAALGKIREDAGERADALRNYQRSYACDRFQPQVATRIAALQSTMRSPLSMRTIRDGTRLVDRSPTPMR